MVDDADTGLWHTLHTYVDLTVRRPDLPLGRAPAAARREPPYDPRHRTGALSWDEALTVGDAVATVPGRGLVVRLQRDDPARERYHVYLLREVPDPACPHAAGCWIDTPADWARLRGGA